MSKSKVMKPRNPFTTTLGQFETGDAPQNYTNLTFFPSQQLDKFYEGSKIGDTDVAQVRLNNEELFRKDPFYQAKLNLLNPIVSATKYIENKSVKEMQEELLKEKYRELKSRKKLLKGVPENLQRPLLNAIQEAQLRPSRDRSAVLKEYTDQLQASGDIDDRQARDIRHFAENALRTTVANQEAEDRTIIGELAVARETVANALRAELGDISPEELQLLAIQGIDNAVGSFRDLGVGGRDVDRLVSEGLIRARGLARSRTQELTDLLESPASVAQSEDIPSFRTDVGDGGRGVIGEPSYLYRETDFRPGRTTFGRPQRPDIWGFEDDETGLINNFETGAGGGSGIRIQPARSLPSLRLGTEIDDYTGLPPRTLAFPPSPSLTRPPARQVRRGTLLEERFVARESETRPTELMVPEEFREQLGFARARGRPMRPPAITLPEERIIGPRLEREEPRRRRGRPRQAITLEIEGESSPVIEPQTPRVELFPVVTPRITNPIVRRRTESRTERRPIGGAIPREQLRRIEVV